MSKGEQVEPPSEATRPKAKRSALVPWFLLVALLLGFGVWYTIDRRQDVGKEGHLIGSTAPGQTLFSRSDFLSTYRDSSTLSSLAGLPPTEMLARIDELERSGQIIRVLKGTKVVVVEHKFLGNMIKVQLLDDAHKGETAWIMKNEVTLNP
jgi:hypothetical protein